MHLQLKPGTNVAVINALAHVIVTERLAKDDFVAERCEPEPYAKWKAFVAEARNSPEATEAITGVPADLVRQAARLYATAGNGAIYYGLGVTEHSQGTTTVMGIANLAMATGNLGREGVGVNPLRGQNNVQGSCDMGSFPHEFTGYRHVSDASVRHLFEAEWGVTLQSEPGLRIPNMFEAALDGTFKGDVRAGRGLRAVRSQHASRQHRHGGDGVRDRAGPVPERDGEVRARVPAGLLVPGEGRHLHQRRAAHLARAQGHASRSPATRTGRSPCCCRTRSAIR